MAVSKDPETRLRMMAEIDRLISEAIANRQIVVARATAADMARAFPGAGLSLAQISEEITRKGIQAGAALEMGG